MGASEFSASATTRVAPTVPPRVRDAMARPTASRDTRTRHRIAYGVGTLTRVSTVAKPRPAIIVMALSTKNGGVFDDRKKACFTEPKPQIASTNGPTTTATVTQRKRSAVATRPTRRGLTTPLRLWPRFRDRARIRRRSRAKTRRRKEEGVTAAILDRSWRLRVLACPALAPTDLAPKLQRALAPTLQRGSVVPALQRRVSPALPQPDAGASALAPTLGRRGSSWIPLRRAAVGSGARWGAARQG